MKIHRHITTSILAAGALLLAGQAQIQAQSNLVVATFNTGVQGQPTGGSYQGYNMSVPYGAGTIVWDGITFDAADGSTGSAYITANFSGANNTDVLVSMGPGYNNWYYENGQNCPGFLSGTADFSQYHAVQFDILYDTNSTLTIGQFNTGQNWPASYLNAGLGSNYMATNSSYYTAGVNVLMFSGSGGNNTYLGTFQIPTAASNGWQTVTMPYSDTIGGLSTAAGLWFQGAFGGGSGINGGPYSASFWIDNVVLVANPTSNPPPKVSIAPVVKGLNLFTGSALNNRESLENTNHNFSWVNAAGPVSYSFTISSYPVPAADQVQNHIFLVPSPSAGSAPDYADPNVVFLDMESTGSGGASMTFRYKTNQPNGNSMIYGSGALAAIQTTTGVGTWTVTFSNNTNVTMSGPGGVSTNFALPDPAGATSALFASNVFLFYGSQANSASGENDHTVTSDFNVTGLGAANFDDNFVADAGTLNTNLWTVNAAIPQCVLLLGPGNPYFVAWTLPASGFSLSLTTNLSANATWTSPATYAPLVTGSTETQLISANDLPPGGQGFFAMIKRTFTQMLVLLPGETSAPGTLTGKSGSPTAQNTSGLVNVTVLAVDSRFYPVGGITDNIQLGSSDGAAILPNPANMVNGTVTFSTFLFQTGGGGTQTISAMDTLITATNISTATSSPVVVN